MSSNPKLGPVFFSSFSTRNDLNDDAFDNKLSVDEFPDYLTG